MSILFILLLPVLIVVAATPLGVTILGWVAVSQIRRSAGTLHGLGLAVFDGLAFPLLSLDLLILRILYIASQMPLGFFDDFGRPDTSFLLLATILVSVPVDWLIVRRVWRAVKQPLAVDNPTGHVPSIATASKAVPVRFALAVIGFHALALVLAVEEFMWVALRSVIAFAANGADLPLATQVTVGLSNLLSGWGALLLLALLFAGAAICWLAYNLGRRKGLIIWSVCLMIVLLAVAAACFWAFTLPARQSALRETPLTHVEFHYRVFEADAALVDKLIPAAKRAAAMQPPAGIQLQYGQVSGSQTMGDFTVSSRGTKLTDAQMAEISPDTLKALLNGIGDKPGLLVDKTRLVSSVWWQPGVADTWSYSRADGTLLGGGGATGFLGFRHRDGQDQIRIADSISHTIDLAGKRGTVDLRAMIFYEGEIPREGVLAFLVPFFQSDDSPHYLIVAYELSEAMDTAAPPATPEEIVRKVHLPDADRLDVGVVLDLASGEMLSNPGGKGEEAILNYFTKLGRGDLAWDQVLLTLRGAQVSEYRDGALVKLSPERELMGCGSYPTELPAHLLVTTAEGADYAVDVLAVKDGGVDVEYQPNAVPLKRLDLAEASPEDPEPTASGTTVMPAVPDAQQPKSAVRLKLVALPILLLAVGLPLLVIAAIVVGIVLVFKKGKSGTGKAIAIVLGVLVLCAIVVVALLVGGLFWSPGVSGGH